VTDVVYGNKEMQV